MSLFRHQTALLTLKVVKESNSEFKTEQKISLSVQVCILDTGLEVLAALLVSFCKDYWMFFKEGDNERGQKELP